MADSTPPDPAALAQLQSLKAALLEWEADTHLSYSERFEKQAEEFYRYTGYMAPGKSVPFEMASTSNEEQRTAAWDAWQVARQQRFRDDILAAATALDQHAAHTRWNVETQDDGTLRLCRGNHDRSAPCEWETFVPERDGLRVGLLLDDARQKLAAAESQVAALTDEIMELREALKALAERHNWTPGMGQCVCQPHFDARRLSSSSLPARSGARETELPAVAGRFDRTLADFERSCLVHLDEEQRRANPDNALIAVLCDAVKLARESTPDPVPLAAEPRTGWQPDARDDNA